MREDLRDDDYAPHPTAPIDPRRSATTTGPTATGPTPTAVQQGLQPIPGHPGLYYNTAGVVFNDAGRQVDGTFNLGTRQFQSGPAAAPNTVGAFVLPDARNVPQNYYANVPAVDPNVNTLVAKYIADKKLTANQSDPAALHDITAYLRGQGIDAQTDYTDVNGHTGGILVNKWPYQLIDGSNNWTPLQAWPEQESKGASSMPPASSMLGQTTSSTSARWTGAPQYLNPATNQIYTPADLRSFVQR